MDFQTHYLSPDIKRSSFEGGIFKTEVVFENHMLVWLISGETKIVLADAHCIFGAGDTFLIPRNQLATIINYPKDGLPHKAVVMHLSTKRLQEFYAKNEINSHALPSLKIKTFNDHPLLSSCLASLIHYFDLQESLPENLASLKIEEAITILRSIDPQTDGLLGSFESPAKVSLTDFMEKNYMFNMTMDKFSYLTGRSLTSFKRDFRQAYNSSPQRWLTKKRLELAHYQIREQRRKPSEVYAEVGFENLSHFTFAFRKQFGYAPTE